MAIKRVWGRCDGVNIIFNQNNATGRWETTVPHANDGEYIVEVFAENEVGATSYYGKVLFEVSVKGLCLNIRILEVAPQYTVEDIKALFKGVPYSAKVRESVYPCSFKYNAYKTEIVKCEICERW